MIQRYFLGCNSGKGFFSLYDGFPPGGAFLHVIKGGPGTGKSGFMRAIGAEAEKRGMEIQYVHCSGDPDSLDGLYIPALGQAWMDGTAPHVREPDCFGANGDYVELGRFCRLPLPEAEAEKVRQLTAAYRVAYERAYRELAEAKALHDELEAVYRPYMDFPALTAYTEETVKRVFSF